MEQLHANMAFKKGHGTASRWGSVRDFGQPGEAAFVERGDEGLHVIDAIHELLRISQH